MSSYSDRHLDPPEDDDDDELTVEVDGEDDGGPEAEDADYDRLDDEAQRRMS